MLVILHADAGALCGWRAGNLKLDGRVGPPIGTLYGAIMKKLKERLERAHRADRHFAIVSVALTVFLILAGCSAWMFGNSRAAAVDPPAKHSTVR
jgi:hypothetical protein